MEQAEGEASRATPAWTALAEHAQTHLDAGRSREAAAELVHALAINPHWAPGWRQLSDLRLFARDLDGASAAWDRSLVAALRDTPLKAAAANLAAGRLDAAEHELAAVLRCAPQATPAAHLLGEVFLRGSRLAAAEKFLGACVHNDPDYAPAQWSYVEALRRMRRWADALERIEALLSRGSGSLRARILKADTLVSLGAFETASVVSRELLDELPDEPRAWAAHGQQLQILGRFDEAVAAARRCLELDPTFASAWGDLAAHKTYRFSTEDEARMAALAASQALPPEDRGAVHFALGKAREAAGDYARSFAHYQSGNAIIGALRPSNPIQMRSMIDRLKALFTPELVAERAGSGVDADDPIFIVGMPRSGSTLVEQILASHPAVEALGELEELSVTADLLAGPDVRRYPLALKAASRVQLAGLGQHYLDATRPYRRLGRPRFIDKAPSNFLYVSLIQLILPKARIIDMRRGAMACCMSAYKENFASGWGFTYDLESLGRAYAEYVELMAHYDAVLPGRVHRISYEALVADTETETRRLLDYLELPFDPACLRFFEAKRAVATASASQVRRPIYRDALEQWRNFEPWLSPLKAALGPALDG